MHKFVVDAIFESEKVVMGSLLSNLAFLQDKNVVGLSDCR